MASYRLRIKQSAIKELESIPSKSDRRRIVKRIEALADDPRPAASQKLSGHDRYRIGQGRYRILYSIGDRQLIVHIIRIGNSDRS